MSYFENGCTHPGWNKKFVAASYTCPGDHQGIRAASAFKDSGKYLQIGNESDADIAFYNLKNSDHSAVREVVGGSFVKYLSKYGADGPLVAHNLNQSFYHLHEGGQVVGPPEFWTFLGPINGVPQIIGTSPVSFNVLSKPGVTYSWSIVEGLSKVFISSGSNQPTVTLTPTHSGTAKLRLTINSGCGAPKIQELSLTIQTNVCLEGTYNIGSSTGINLNTSNQIGTGNVTATVTCPNATSFTWQRTSGSIATNNTAGNYVTFTMISGGSISFSITAGIGSTVLSTRNVSFFNFGSFQLYPNPSSSKLTIDLNRDLKFDIVLQSFDSNIKSEVLGYTGGNEIDISILPKGDYILLVLYEGKVIHQDRLVVSKKTRLWLKNCCLFYCWLIARNIATHNQGSLKRSLYLFLLD